MTKKTTASTGQVVAEISAGLIAAAAAGYYFYASTKAKKHRKIVAKWATDMKKDVIQQTKKLKKIDAKVFAKVVDAVAYTYRGVRSINADEVKRAANELKSHWEMVQREVQKTAHTSVSRVKGTGKDALARGKKTVRKVAKKVVVSKKKKSR